MPNSAAKPLATVAAIGGAVAAGVFLWTRRRQVSDKIGEVSEQISETAKEFRREGKAEKEALQAESSGLAPTPRRRGRRTQAEIAQEALTLKQLGELAAIASD